MANTPAVAQLQALAPILRYHPRERYHATNPNAFLAISELRRRTGQVIAQPPNLNLDYLTRDPYPDGRNWQPGDHIARTHWRIPQPAPQHQHIIYARWATENTDTWAQYWRWHARNAYHHAWGGLHDGDWELVQIKIDPAGAPTHVACAQHRTGELRAWTNTNHIDGHAVIDVDTGSHASRFAPSEPDHLQRTAPPHRLEPIGTWAHWPGRWGNTRRSRLGWHADSPTGPAHKPAWAHPTTWATHIQKEDNHP